MATKMTGKYLGNKNVEIIHEQSGARITTAAPKDNNGDGSSFSPTDLLASSLAACMMTIMGIVAEKNEISLEGAGFEITKIMQPSPRKVGALPITITLPAALEASQRRMLEEAAKACPVCKSIDSTIEVDITFDYSA